MTSSPDHPARRTCRHCGRPQDEHEVDPRTGEPTKCPVPREESDTPPQESARTPRGDY